MEKLWKPPKMKDQKDAKRVLFDSLYFFSAEENSCAGSSLFLEYTLILAITIQKLSLLYFQEMDLKSWEHYELFWFILSLFRVEFAAMRLGYFEVFIYSMAGLMAMSLGVFLLTVNAFYRDTEITYPRIRRILVLIPMSLVSGILEIPLFCVFLVCYRYSGHETSVEYNIAFYYSWHFKVVCFAVFMLQCLFIYTYKFLLYQTRHSLTNKVLDAKSTGLIDGVSACVNFICAFIHFFMLESYPGFAYIISWSLNAILLYKYLVVLPYYSEKISVAHVVSIAVACISCIFFMIGRWQDDGHVVFLLLFVINALLAYPVKHIVLWRLNSIKQIENFQDVTLDNYEKLFRILISDVKLEKFIQSLKDSQVFRKEKQLYIWEAYMLNDIKRQNKRARLILSNSITKEGSIALEFQFFKCSKFLESSATQESFRFIQLWGEFEKAKRLDIRFCKKINKIWGFLLSKGPPVLQIKYLITTSQPLIQMVKEIYQKLIKQDPNNIEILVLYGLLLYDVMGNKQKGLNVLMKAINITKSRPRFVGLTPFGISNGVILFRCHSDYSLMIEYANNRASKILYYSPESLIGESMDRIIPEYYRNAHKRFISRYFTKNTLDIKIPSNFFLLNSEGHIIFVTIHIEIEIYEHIPYFLLTFIPTADQENEDTIVLAPDSTIVGHTKKVLKRLGLSEEIKNKSFQEVFPDTPNLTMRTYEKVKYKRSILFYTTYLVIANSGVYLVNILRKQREETAMGDSALENVSCPFSLDFMFMDIDPHAHEEEKEEEIENQSDGSVMIGVESEDSSSGSSENNQVVALTQMFSNWQEDNAESSTHCHRSRSTGKKTKKELKLIFSRIKKGFILVLLLVALSAFGVNYSISVYNSSLETDLDVYSSLNSSLFAVSTASLAARTLDLQNKGLDLDLKTISLHDVMESSLEVLEQTKDLLIDHGISSLMRDPEIKLIFAENGGLSVEKVSVNEYFIQMIRHLNILLQDTSLKMDNKSMQFIYFNGLVSGLTQLEASQEVYAEDLVKNYRSIIVIANINFSLVLVLTLSVVLLFSTQIQNLRESYKFLWSKLEQISENILQNKSKSLVDRLTILNKASKRISGHKSKHPLVPDNIWRPCAIMFPIYLITSILVLQVLIYSMALSMERILTRDVDLTLLMNKHAVSTIKLYQTSSELPLLTTEYSLHHGIPISFSVESELAKFSKEFKALTKDLALNFKQGRGDEYQDTYTQMFDKRNSLDLTGKRGLISQNNYFLSTAIGLQNDNRDSRAKISEFLYIGYDIWTGESQLRLGLEQSIIKKIKDNSDLLMIYSIAIFSYSVVLFIVLLYTCVKKVSRLLTSFSLFLQYNNSFI